jgi:hypothetical protein
MRRLEAFSGVPILTYALMSNHFHLLCDPGKSFPAYLTCPSFSFFPASTI